MSIIGSLTKQSFEAFDASIDFVNLIKGVETISLTGGGVTSIKDSTGADSTSTIIALSPAAAISGTKVTFRVNAGVDTDSHTITAKVVASGGEKYAANIRLLIVDK